MASLWGRIVSRCKKYTMQSSEFGIRLKVVRSFLIRMCVDRGLRGVYLRTHFHAYQGPPCSTELFLTNFLSHALELKQEQDRLRLGLRKNGYSSEQITKHTKTPKMKEKEKAE